MICIIQARTGSVRLPKKVLLRIGNISILQRIINSLKEIKTLKKIVVATSNLEKDQKIVKVCKKNNIDFFKGSEKNVASRFYYILSKSKSKYFLRINGDSPFIDAQLISEMIKINNFSKYDIITNVYKRTFPKGQSIEFIKKNFFLINYKKFKYKRHFEHVSSFFYEKNIKCKIYNYTNKENFSDVNLSVDTKEDFLKLKKIYEKLKSKKINYKNLIQEYLKFHEKKQQN